MVHQYKTQLRLVNGGCLGGRAAENDAGDASLATDRPGEAMRWMTSVRLIFIDNEAMIIQFSVR